MKIILNSTEIKIIKTRLTKKFVSRENCNHRTFARNEARREEETLVCKTSIRQKTPTAREIGFNYIKHAKPPLHDQNIS